MSDGIPDLENRLGNRGEETFKSEGERKIAYFLDRNDIAYQYEPAVLVHADQGKTRIWYPDFYLGEFKAYIEYFGMVGDRSYDRGVMVKQSVYQQAGLDVISIYPWMLKENWQGYIMGELEKTTLRRYRGLMAKPYWSRRNQPLRQSRSTPGYGGRKMKGY